MLSVYTLRYIQGILLQEQFDLAEQLLPTATCRQSSLLEINPLHPHC